MGLPGLLLRPVNSRLFSAAGSTIFPSGGYIGNKEPGWVLQIALRTHKCRTGGLQTGNLYGRQKKPAGILCTEPGTPAFQTKGLMHMNDVQVPLNCLRTGQKGTVLQIDLSGALEQRLTDLGLVEGTQVACRMTAPPGDPLAFELRGAVIAQRASDAKHILCRLEGGG